MADHQLEEEPIHLLRECQMQEHKLEGARQRNLTRLVAEDAQPGTSARSAQEEDIGQNMSKCNRPLKLSEQRDLCQSCCYRPAGTQIPTILFLGPAMAGAEDPWPYCTRSAAISVVALAKQLGVKVHPSQL
ncbi:MAG: hypothetical protein GY696_36335 [Gammaproteobacteria bacterium]|nr:hypothetical protein [Gammaproteobacteria bacterium]